MLRIKQLFQDDNTNATLNVKATAGLVYSVIFFNTGASAFSYQLHDTATTPSNGAVPKINMRIGSGSTFILGSDFFTKYGVAFSNGIAFAISSSALTLTLSSSTNQQSRIVYS